REVLRPTAQRLKRTALRIHGTVGIALPELTLRVAHGLAGLPELLAHIALALLALLAGLLTGLLPEAALAQLLHQLVELIAQSLLLLGEVAHAILALLALLPLLALLTSLSLLAALSLSAALPALVLSLLEGTVAQLLLPPDQVAQLIELVHHVVVA